MERCHGNDYDVFIMALQFLSRWRNRMKEYDDSDALCAEAIELAQRYAGLPEEQLFYDLLHAVMEEVSRPLQERWKKERGMGIQVPCSPTAG